MEPPAPPTAEQLRRARAALAAAGLGTMMLTLDNTVVTVALPAIQRSFGTPLASLQLVLVLYMVAQGVALLVAGYFADRYGRRRTFLIGLGVFTASSLLCALAPSAAILDLARTSQGIGSAILLAGGVALMSAETPPALRGRAFGIWGALLGTGLAAGPIVGGLLVTYAGWPWIFLLNVPIGVIVFLIAFRGTGESWHPTPRGADWTGLAIFTSLVLAALVGVEAAPSIGWTSPVTITLFAAAAGLTLGFVLWERRARYPAFELDLFRRRPFILGAVGAVAIGLSFWTMLLYFPLYFESFVGYSAAFAGLALLPLAAPFALFSFIGGRVVGRVSSSTLFVVGLAIVTVGSLWLLLPGAGAGWVAFSGGLAVVGAGTGLYQAEITRIAVSAAPDAQAGVAGGMNMTLRCMGPSFAWAVVAVLFVGQISSSFLANSSGSPLDLPALLPSVAAQIAVGDFAGGWSIFLAHGVNPALYPSYLSFARASYFDGMRLVFGVAAVSAALGAGLSLMLRSPHAPASLSAVGSVPLPDPTIEP